MKTISLIFVLLTIAYSTYAQEEILVSVDAKRTSPEEIPDEVIKSLKTDFPSMKVLEYYVFPNGKIGPEWTMSDGEIADVDATINHYTVLIKGTKGGYINALYDKNGDLKSMKILAKDFALPDDVRKAATSGKYEGYTVKSDKFVRIVNHSKNKEYIEVVVAKANDTRKLYFDKDGKLVKEK